MLNQSDTPSNPLSHSAAKALIRAAVTIVDGDGEYEAGDSFARIAVIDAAITVRVDDGNGDTHIEIETEGGIQFHAIAENFHEFEIQIYHPCEGDWEALLLEYAAEISNSPSQHWTGFDEEDEQ